MPYTEAQHRKFCAEYGRRKRGQRGTMRVRGGKRKLREMCKSGVKRDARS